MKTQSGGRHIIYYAINVVDHDGNEMTIGEGFRGESEVKAAMRMIAQELDLGVERGSEQPRKGAPLFGEDVLTSDF